MKFSTAALEEERHNAWRHRQADELAALRAFVREVSQQKTDCQGQRQSNKERAEDLCEQWGITA